MPWLLIGLVGLVVLAVASRGAAAPPASSVPLNGLGLNIDAAGPSNTGFLGSVYANAAVTLQSSKWGVSLGPALAQLPTAVSVMQTSGPTAVNCPTPIAPICTAEKRAGLVGCLQLCGFDTSAGTATGLTPGSYGFIFMTPTGASGTFSFLVVPANG
jgi:hypothetical protein